MIIKELYPRQSNLNLDIDFENRVCDIAIEQLSTIKECDGASVYVKWVKVDLHSVPLLYILFSQRFSERMPKVHIDELGEMKACHAICLMSLPSFNVISYDKMKYVIKNGVEKFLREFDVSTNSKVNPSTR